MKIVTAFDLGVLIARANLTKSAENPLVTATANQWRDENARRMNTYQQSKNPPAPLNIPGALGNLGGNLTAAIHGGAQMAASPPQLPSWALNYRASTPAQAPAPAADNARRMTSNVPLPSFGAGGDPLNPNPAPAPQIDPARASANAYHQNKALQRASAGSLRAADLSNPANAYHAARAQTAAGPDPLNPGAASRPVVDPARAAANAYHQNKALQQSSSLAKANDLGAAR